MCSAKSESPSRLYALLPSVAILLESPELAGLRARLPRELVLRSTRTVLDQIRGEIAAEKHTQSSLAARVEAICEAIADQAEAALVPSLRPVLNATGVLLHTGLGRAPLSKAAVDNIASVASGYCNLELDLTSGERGRRDSHVERSLLTLLASLAEQPPENFLLHYAALVVNNCAAATLLALNSLAQGGDVIVSRGELVEIGGGFRVPDIMARSGAHLCEIGTTNRTRIGDYAAAITPETKLILRVHQSNFRIEGFTAKPALEELVDLCGTRNLPLFEDQGTGCIASLEAYGIELESSLVESIRCGVPLVAASGDKLLGGPQCGLLVGRRALIDTMRSNPLLRAFRVDKLTYAALETTLQQYLSGRGQDIPVLKMLALTAEEIQSRCEVLAGALQQAYPGAQVVPVRSPVGGGTTPGASLPSFAVSLVHPRLAPTAFAALLRTQRPATLARISRDCVLLDLRTIPTESDVALLRMLLDTCVGHSVR